MARITEGLKLSVLFFLVMSGTAFAQRPKCSDLLLSLPLQENAGDLFWRTQKRLQSFGFESKIVKYERTEGLGKVPVIKITRFSDRVRTGRIMSRAQERFGARFYVDPLLISSGEGRALTEEPSRIVVMDSKELGGDLNMAPIALLHEIRHLYFADVLRRSDKDSIYFGDIESYLDDYRLHRGNFYHDEVSLDELSTYYRDLRVALRRYRLGQIGRAEAVRDVQKLHKIVDLIERQLHAVDPHTDPRAIQTRRRPDALGFRVVYPIYRGLPLEENVAAHLIMKFVSDQTATLTKSQILEMSRQRISQLLGECERLRSFADEIQKTLD
jgi:hypothetical protein